MNINWPKLLTADFTLGKVINLRKALADSVGLLIQDPTWESLELTKVMLTVKPQYTMVTNKNLITLYQLTQRVNTLGLAGDIVECGVWNGGSGAVMGWANAKSANSRVNRTIWLFDSFEGLPRPTENDGKVERDNYFEGWCKGDVNKVRRIFSKLGVPMEGVKIVPGWFEGTLRSARVDRIAILHIDADWYDSVKLVLEAFYEKVVPGGFIVLNDYGAWPGCNKAIDDYIVEHHLREIKMTIVEPSTGAYFQKPLMQHI